MASGRHEYEEGTTEVGSDFKDLGMGGGGFQYLHHLLQGSSASGALIQIRYVGDDPLDRTNHGGFPPQGGPLYVRVSTEVKLREYMGVYAIGGGDGRVSPGGGGDVLPPPPKHNRPIYCNLYDIGSEQLGNYH